MQKDKRLAKVISIVGSISYEPHSEHPYAFLIHEIIERMLSIKAGAKIYARLEDLCAGSITVSTINSFSNEHILNYYFLQLCGYDGIGIKDELLKKYRDDFVKKLPDGTEDCTELHIAATVTIYVNKQ